MKEKIDKSKEVILSGMRGAGYPVLAWSGGKDSMALIYLMWEMGLRMPVMFFREQWQPWKYKFQDMIIRELGLEVYTWHPAMSKFQQTDDEFEVQNLYKFGLNEVSQVTCPTGITPMEDGKPWACGIDIYSRPKNEMLKVNWDTMFIGHKGCDTDIILGGDIGTRIDIRVFPVGANSVFPLKDWTHEDIWQYITDNDIPFDSDRYECVDGVWGEKKDRSYNCDYVHACMACIDKRGPKVVYCPKYNQDIENISDRVEWAEKLKLSYMED